MNKIIIAAAALVPALALATPIATTTASTKPAKAAKAPKQNGGGSIGSAQAGDVTLNGIAASGLVYSAGVNPQQGAQGNASGFATQYAGNDWAGFAKFSSGANGSTTSATLSGLALTMGFALTDTRHGTWSITNTDAANALSLDLVFAMHTGGGSGSWLFDNLVVDAGATLQGSWSLNLLNNGGQLADYSNLTLFSRDALATPVRFAEETSGPAGTPVPVPVAVADPEPVASPLPVAVADPIVVPEPLPVAGPATLPPEYIATPAQLPQAGADLGGASEHAADGEVPEPATLGIFATGLALCVAMRRRRRA